MHSRNILRRGRGRMISAIRKPTSGGREELARALPLAFGKLAQQILVTAAQEVRLHVVQSETVTWIGVCLDDAA